jgi:hypothetical protein
MYKPIMPRQGSKYNASQVTDRFPGFVDMLVCVELTFSPFSPNPFKV